MKAVALADELETELRLPRITKRQSYRCNTQALDPERFFRTSVYIPLLDNELADLKYRFNDDTFDVSEFVLFMPVPAAEYHGIRRQSKSSQADSPVVWIARKARPNKC
ncbi:hypothetical protein HPB48_008498 [Haemaphysalis longicornis]|uniref:Uncharacterized protein n=1 Tax=Haemaphysalis longicornis TaxID=44386 RepID=A0A9J6GT66_HAELO|nr:hypothetical protein HPB48_008498 [Haemaphysalis longicornis]